MSMFLHFTIFTISCIFVHFVSCTVVHVDKLFIIMEPSTYLVRLIFGFMALYQSQIRNRLGEKNISTTGGPPEPTLNLRLAKETKNINFTGIFRLEFRSISQSHSRVVWSSL